MLKNKINKKPLKNMGNERTFLNLVKAIYYKLPENERLKGEKFEIIHIKLHWKCPFYFYSI